MPIFEAGGRSPAQTLTQKPIANLVLPAANGQVAVREIGVFNVNATSSAIALLRSTARGTQTATLAGQPLDSSISVASRASLDSAWSADPTGVATTTFHRRAMLPATIGAGFVWSFWGDSNGLLIPNTANAGILLATAAAPSASSIWEFYYVWEE